MNRKFKQTLGISLIASAVTLLLSLPAFSDSKKKASPLMGFLAVIGGFLGLFLVKDAKLPCLKKETEEQPTELFEEKDLEDIGAVMNAELFHTNDGEDSGAPRLDIEIPRDDEASEADFA